jgi:hypothetical protein
MSIATRPYCTILIVREVDPRREETFECSTFDEVITFLRKTHTSFADVIADRRAEENNAERVSIGGFGVTLINRWQDKVEVGIGRDVWFLARTTAVGTLVFSDKPSVSGTMAFFLAGSHHTELESRQLVSRNACAKALRDWLDKNEFPESACMD